MHDINVTERRLFLNAAVWLFATYPDERVYLGYTSASKGTAPEGTP